VRTVRHAHRKFRGAALLLVLLACAGTSHVDRSERLLASGDAREALDVLLPQAEVRRRDPAWQRQLALAAAAAGEERIAAAALRRAERISRRDSVRVQPLRRALWRERFADVAALLETATPVAPEDLSGALGRLDRAAQIDSSRAPVWAARGEILMRLGRPEPADSAFARAESALAGDPEAVGDVVGALVRTSEACAARSDLDMAIAHARWAERIDSTDVRALYDLGVHTYRLADRTADRSAFETAAGYFQRVIERLPDDTDARYNLTLTRLKLGQLEAARAAAERFVARDLLSARAHRLVAQVALAMNDRDAATAHVASMRALDGEEAEVPDAYPNVSEVAGHAGRKHFVMEGAPDHVRRYTESDGRAVEVWFYVNSARIRVFRDGRLIAGRDLVVRAE
jgi:tetratricopeptide (TPR) repeat protein